MMVDQQRELREAQAEIGDQRLHYLEVGEGPLIVLLHGFPEFWYGWRQRIKPLAAAGFRVVAPDPHPRKLSQGLHHPGQLKRSWHFCGSGPRYRYPNRAQPPVLRLAI
jgi:pimeloyl-ACP methyl ester carboxylesterase